MESKQKGEAVKGGTAFVAIALVIILSGAAGGASLRITAGTSIAVSVWQSSPPIYSDSTYWGGLGLDLAFGVFTVGAAVTITDFETLTITRNPSFSFGVSAAPLRVGPVSAGVGAGLMVTPSSGFMTVSGSVFTKWLVTTSVSIRAGLTYQTTLAGVSPQGATINIGLGVSYYYPLF